MRRVIPERGKNTVYAGWDVHENFFVAADPRFKKIKILDRTYF